MVDLTGKVAVVTGAGGVLCSVLGKALASCGAKVALLDLNEEACHTVARQIVADGGQAQGYVCNVLEKAALEKVCQSIMKEWGSIDILVNGAGGNHPRATTNDEYYDRQAPADSNFFDLDPQGVEFVFSLNFMGSFLPSQVFAHEMKEGSTIINISSMNAFTPLTKIPAYSAAKASISNFTQWLAVYFAKAGIRCNALAPGFFATSQNARLLFNENGEPTPRLEKILAGTPMARLGKPEEIVGTLLYLVDEKASGFVNGVVIPIDGGFSAYSGV